MSDELNYSTDKKRHRKKRDKHNHSDADFESANTTEATSLDLVPECSKKRKHKKTKQKFDDSDEHLHAFNCNKETGVEMELKKQSIATGDAHKKFKPQDNKQASETSCDANMTEKTIKRKNKKKEKTVSTDTLVSCDNTEPPNKKKKSDTFNDDVSVSLKKPESAYIQMSERTLEKQGKKQKLKMQLDAEVNSENVINHATSNNTVSSILKKESNKHHKKTGKHFKNIDTSLPETECIVHTKKHKDKSKLTCHIDNGTSEGEVHTKKRKDKSKLTCHIDNGTSEGEVHTKKRKDKSKLTCHIDNGAPESNVNEHVSYQVHLHKKKRVTDLTISQDEMNCIAKEQNNSITSELDSTRHHKKRSKLEDSSLSADNIKRAQDKLSKEVNDDSSISHKNDADSTSGLPHVNKTTASGCTALVQGQWQGNLFESSERQNKFLRLLGGMKKSVGSNESTGETKKELTGAVNNTKKKGLFGSLTSMTSTGNSTAVNQALSAKAADSLNQKLEEEYNRAMNFKLTVKRGTGFGFVADPSEGKTFHIDVHKSKSIKFDD